MFELPSAKVFSNKRSKKPRYPDVLSFRCPDDLRSYIAAREALGYPRAEIIVDLLRFAVAVYDSLETRFPKLKEADAKEASAMVIEMAILGSEGNTAPPKGKK